MDHTLGYAVKRSNTLLEDMVHICDYSISKTLTVSCRPDPQVQADLDWLVQLCDGDRRILPFFLSLGADNSTNVYFTFLEEIYKSISLVRDCSAVSSYSSEEAFDFLSQLWSRCSPKDRSNDSHPDEPGKSYVPGNKRKHSVFRMVCNGGIDSARHRFAVIQIVLLQANLLATSESDKNLVRCAAGSAYQAFRRPAKSSSPTLSSMHADMLDSYIAQSESVYELFLPLRTAGFQQVESGRDVSVWTSLCSHVSSLAPIFLKYDRSSTQSQGDVIPSFLAQVLDIELDFGAEVAIQRPSLNKDVHDQGLMQDSSVRQSSGLSVDLALDGAEIAESSSPVVEVSLSDRLTSEDAEGLPSYVMHRSIGKLRRARGMHPYSKELFNEIERSWLVDHFEARLADRNCTVDDLITLLSMTLGRTGALLAGLTFGGLEGGVVQGNLYRISVSAPENAAEPDKELSKRCRPTRDEFFVKLPSLLVKYLRYFGLHEKNGVELGVALGVSGSELEEAVKASIKQVREKHGTRFNKKRVESQLRYYIASKTKDMSLLDIIFGHGEKAVPVQRYYRYMLIDYVESVFHESATSY